MSNTRHTFCPWNNECATEEHIKMPFLRTGNLRKGGNTKTKAISSWKYIQFPLNRKGGTTPVMWRKTQKRSTQDISPKTPMGTKSTWATKDKPQSHRIRSDAKSGRGADGITSIVTVTEEAWPNGFTLTKHGTVTAVGVSCSPAKIIPTPAW